MRERRMAPELLVQKLSAAGGLNRRHHMCDLTPAR
jgi:hypothetical protein